jgi:hypothetical protein
MKQPMTKHRAVDALIDAMRQHYDKSVNASCACDEEPNMEEGKVVARYPKGYHVQTEGDEIVVYSKAPNTKTDLFDFKTTQDHRPPRTLAEMNKFFAGYYPRRRTTAAR